MLVSPEGRRAEIGITARHSLETGSGKETYICNNGNPQYLSEVE